MEQEESAARSTAILRDLAGCKVNGAGLQAIADGCSPYAKADCEGIAERDIAPSSALLADCFFSRRKSGKRSTGQFSRKRHKNFQLTSANAEPSSAGWRFLLFRSPSGAGSPRRESGTGRG